MGNRGLKPGQKALVGAGRQKGVPNKSTFELRAAIAAACGEDWDPVVSMARIAKEGVMDVYDPATGEKSGTMLVSEKTRTTCHKEVSEYVHAKRKAVELSTPDGPLDLTLHNDVKAVDALSEMLEQLNPDTAKE